MTNDYTPDTKSVEIAYVYADDYSTDTYEERKEAFYNWLRKVQADTWHEGWATYYRDATANPYLAEYRN